MNNIPLYEYTTFCLLIHQLMVIEWAPYLCEKHFTDCTIAPVPPSSLFYPCVCIEVVLEFLKRSSIYLSTGIKGERDAQKD